MICHERITLSARSETYCMRDEGHPGPHSIHPDTRPKPQLVQKEPVRVRVAGSASAAD